MLLNVAHKISTERVNNIRQLLLSNKIYFTVYYFSDIIVNMTIQGIGLVIMLLNFRHYSVQKLNNDQINQFILLIFFKKLSFLGFSIFV